LLRAAEATALTAVVPAKAGTHNHRMRFRENHLPAESTDRFRGMCPGLRQAFAGTTGAITTTKNDAAIARGAIVYQNFTVTPV
jgi:hypothetical protein